MFSILITLRILGSSSYKVNFCTPLHLFGGISWEFPSTSSYKAMCHHAGFIVIAAMKQCPTAPFTLKMIAMD